LQRLTEFAVVEVNIAFAARSVRTVNNLQAIVLAIEGSTAALEPMDRRDTVELPARSVDTVVTFDHRGAVVGLKGILTKRGDGTDLRFSVADGVVLPRRGATRVTVAVPMAVRGAHGDEQPATSVNVSANGLLMESAQTCAPGDQVEVRLWPDSPEGVRARARVIRADGGLVAVELAQEELEARSQLAGFVVEFNRQTVRRGRFRDETPSGL